MEFEQLKEVVAKHIKLITFSSDALREADERCTKFLVIQSVLADFKLQLEQDKAKLETLVNATYHQVLTKLGEGQITKNKIAAEADPDYAVALEALNDISATIGWVKAYLDIFNNAHITYRNKAKE